MSARYETRSGARTPRRLRPTGLLEGMAGDMRARAKVGPFPKPEAPGGLYEVLLDAVDHEADQLEALEVRVYQVGRVARDEEA